ncbi:membrane protein TE32 [Testudinid alphaherpesvirus 3]|uniref:Glycoprotein-E like protein n=1 Tax=Testudinid alphaherpesvirus 3 TaxID=2560801 RepID=A0A0K1R176_9ALPH|nr:membrane protein TE32 [Testudinid alphaherpesvirus 3]AIU39305.1 membrane protein TE32 [Testudinid alphaherpesvirus 3]AIU39415.1 membrane protein TE32 [Testudinid alphaherpesvirus 3]AKI81691.1 membrane protein TE32 [Testudinid alphaherpesvirus 3]AKI81794.1 membrane protein TE32 [Testudinid alphaherpesvirus 3]AKV40658.1 glycoprotein-E like protein [Testudinid alphaherpesvirus 3]
MCRILNLSCLWGILLVVTATEIRHRYVDLTVSEGSTTSFECSVPLERPEGNVTVVLYYVYRCDLELANLTYSRGVAASLRTRMERIGSNYQNVFTIKNFLDSDGGQFKCNTYINGALLADTRYNVRTVFDPSHAIVYQNPLSMMEASDDCETYFPQPTDDTTLNDEDPQSISRNRVLYGSLGCIGAVISIGMGVWLWWKYKHTTTKYVKLINDKVYSCVQSG